MEIDTTLTLTNIDIMLHPIDFMKLPAGVSNDRGSQTFVQNHNGSVLQYISVHTWGLYTLFPRTVVSSAVPYWEVWPRYIGKRFITRPTESLCLSLRPPYITFPSWRCIQQYFVSLGMDISGSAQDTRRIISGN